MVTAKPEIAQVWTWLEEVADPEIPVISVVDLGIVRDVRWNGEELIVAVTPTYSGCPATEVIARDIRDALLARGIENVRIETKISPAWTTDWISGRGRERLREYGIAPPPTGLIQIENVACPRCGSTDTEMVSRFGSTPCKAIYRCRACLEPFDVFKRH
ncbi:MAG TPA: 1,2-phenylacetyl-CoA epoxidase subunit PaaD [Bryobacteraceae bacterium]|nr:1,2-phenylacetyl-CoA epoxidase subunit PaaD [Bryobacteraceae bacterium]